MPLDRVVCPSCGWINHLNPEKHRERNTYCVKCRTVVAEGSHRYSGIWPLVKERARELRNRLRPRRTVELPPEYLPGMREAARQILPFAYLYAHMKKNKAEQEAAK